MSATATATSTGDVVRARQAGFVRDLATVAKRALRSIPREPETVIPALVVPLFFFVVNTGSLQDVTEGIARSGLSEIDRDFDYKAFQLPVAIVFAVTGVSRASTLVTDIQTGYFDRLTMTPIRRLALLLGLMVADYALVVALAVPVIVLGLALGVTFETGVIGMVAFALIAGLWGLVFTGFPYAIALATGSPGAVNSSFILFFPFAFLTSTFVPEPALTGWLSAVSTYNPVTYLLRGLRSLVTDGWVLADLAVALAAIAAVGVVSLSLAFAALRGRVARG